MSAACSLLHRDLYRDRDIKPQLLAVNFDAIPNEMANTERWVLWRLEWRDGRDGGGEWAKIPCRADGRRASSTDPTTWSNYDEVRAAFGKGGWDGVGFMLGDDWAGVDLDSVRDAEASQLTPEAADCICTLATYAEVSPSGTGVKLIGRGSWNGDSNRTSLGNGAEIEVYSSGRYFAITGHRVEQFPIVDIQKPLDHLAPRFEKKKPPKQVVATPRPAINLDDAALIEKARSSTNGAKFSRLWAGDSSDYGGDESRADLALCSMLAFWTGGDQPRIDSLFRQSGRMRAKWDERRGDCVTYGTRTIMKAVNGKSEFYSLAKAVGAMATGGNDASPSANDHADSALIVTRLSRIKAKPVRYLVPGRIPAGKLMLVAGRGGSGKSTWSRSLAADISTGRCAFGMSYPAPPKGQVMIVAAEDGTADTILTSLLANGADLDNIAVLEGVKHDGKKTDFTLRPEHVELVREKLRQANGTIKLIIIDPITSFVGRAKVDDHRATELRTVLDPLSAIAEEFGVTILMIAHLNKTTGEAVDRIAGSAAYRDAVRAAYLATDDHDDDTRRLMVPVKENLPGFDRSSIPFRLEKLNDTEAGTVMSCPQFTGLGAEDRAAIRDQLQRVRFDPPVKVDPNDATNPRGKKDDRTKIHKCVEWMRGFLCDHAYPSQEILDAAKRNGFTFDNVKEAKAQLKAEGLQNSNMGRLQGTWWSGFGHAEGWTLRPSTPPGIPAPHSPYTPLSPFSP